MLKKIVLFVLVLALAFSSASCGEYNPPVNGGNSGSGGGNVMDDDPTNDFTVTLRYNEQPYIPTIAIDVYWSDGFDIFIAPVDAGGVARIDGLDGNYKITLSSVPSGYAYNANGYKATNLERNVIVDLYDLNTITGKGTDLYSCYGLSGTGIYSVTITEPGDTVFFEFSPQMNGTYTVESWASTADDEVNPIATAYFGTSSYKHSPYTVTDTGEVGSFTRNFLHTVKIADEMISSGGGGSQTFTFAVTAETKSGVYPVTFSFAIKRNGGFDLMGANKVMMPITEDLSDFDFDSFNALAGGTIHGAQTLFKDKDGNEKPGAYVFDEKNYKIWEKSQGGDGVYHLYDEVKYASTGGYGPMLVAYITEPCNFIDKAFTTIESVGNNALTVNGYENYKQFIEGWESLASQGYYCVFDCPCHDEGEVNKACPTSCNNCKSTCTKCPPEMMNQPGYASYANADGVVPVTKELAEFLQKFAVSQRYFADGDGWAEKKGIYAYEESQWLFACGYYE